MRGAAAHGVLGLAADRLDRVAQSVLAAIHIEGAVDLGAALAHIGAHRLELGGGEDRTVELQQFALALVLVHDVAEIPEPCLQAHHPLLPE